LLSKEKLKLKFPYLNVEDVELGSHGLQNEGWYVENEPAMLLNDISKASQYYPSLDFCPIYFRFDPWSLLNGFKKKAISLGAEYVTAEVVDFEYKMRPGLVQWTVNSCFNFMF